VAGQTLAEVYAETVTRANAILDGGPREETQAGGERPA